MNVAPSCQWVLPAVFERREKTRLRSQRDSFIRLSLWSHQNLQQPLSSLDIIGIHLLEKKTNQDIEELLLTFSFTSDIISPSSVHHHWEEEEKMPRRKQDCPKTVRKHNCEYTLKSLYVWLPFQHPFSLRYVSSRKQLSFLAVDYHCECRHHEINSESRFQSLLLIVSRGEWGWNHWSRIHDLLFFQWSEATVSMRITDKWVNRREMHDSSSNRQESIHSYD